MQNLYEGFALFMKKRCITMLNVREYLLNTKLNLSLLTYEQKGYNNSSPNNIIGFNKKQIAMARNLKTTNYISSFCSMLPILFW
jgi:hypothetical protein